MAPKAMKAMNVMKAMKTAGAIKKAKKAMKKAKKAMTEETKALTKAKKNTTKAGGFQVLITVCRRCREGQEVVRAQGGLLTFKEYYCRNGCSQCLEIHAAYIE